MGKLECIINKIEGKDIGAILGFDKYRNISNVYEEKINSIENSPRVIEANYWINNIEEVLSREFMLRTGTKVRKINISSMDDDYEFMKSSVNRKIIGENSILDCKVMNKINECNITNEEFLKKFEFQAQHDMKLKKADKCYLAMLFNGEKFIIKKIKRDESLISRIIKVEKKFWNDYVEKRIEPKNPLSLDEFH